MGNFYSSWKITLFVLFIAIAQDLGAVICRPVVTAGMGDPDGLNDCINAANGSPEDYIIDLGGGIYTLTTIITNDDSQSGNDLGLLPITTTGTLSIVNGAIERSRAAADEFGFFSVYSGATLILFNITLENGNVLNSGGAIYNAGVLNLENCLLQGNSAGGVGGAIYNSGTITNIVTSKLVNNTASGNGGAIDNAGTIYGINETTIAGNSAIAAEGVVGGGIANEFTGVIASITNTTISGNTSAFGGGLYTDGDVTFLSNSTFYGNQGYEAGGGGIYVDDDGSIGSLDNCTISGNSTEGGGGGIYNGGTISGLHSNIVANNTAGSGPQDIFNQTGGTITTEGFNLIGDNSSTTIVDGVNNDIVIGAGVDPGLGPLQDNGGPTYTMAVLPQSFALNNGYNLDSLLYDQRGSPYQRVVCSVPDIGAFEYQHCNIESGLSRSRMRV